MTSNLSFLSFLPAFVLCYFVEDTPKKNAGEKNLVESFCVWLFFRECEKLFTTKTPMNFVFTSLSFFTSEFCGSLVDDFTRYKSKLLPNKRKCDKVCVKGRERWRPESGKRQKKHFRWQIFVVYKISVQI